MAVEKARTVPREIVVEGRLYRLVEDDAWPAEPVTATRPRVPAAPSPVADLLTPRELEIAGLVAAGRATKQIAGELGISEWTVSTHLRRTFLKLAVDSRAAMVARCFGEGGVALPPHRLART
jgi:DNA-binding CsgD family transcriptional regulator